MVEFCKENDINMSKLLNDALKNNVLPEKEEYVKVTITIDKDIDTTGKSLSFMLRNEVAKIMDQQ